MKKSILAIVFASAFASSAFASDSHSNFVGSVDKFNGTIRSAEQVKDLVKYTDAKTATKLLKSFNEDGKLTAQEVKESGISDHHFYTGYLAASTTQSQYDARMKELNGGRDMNDAYVSNRDLKAHGSMVMNQVEAGNKLQDARMDKVVAGLKDLGNFIQAQTPTLPEGEKVETEQGNTSNPDTSVDVPSRPAPNLSGTVANNSNSIKELGQAFEQRVDIVNDYLSQAGDAIKGNADKINNLQSAFESQAAHTTSEIARLDGRIDSLEQKTDKLKAGVAGATAIASLTQYTGNGTHHIAVGVGGYDGASALAGGYTYAVSSSTTVRATIALDSENEIAVGASVGHSW